MPRMSRVRVCRCGIGMLGIVSGFLGLRRWAGYNGGIVRGRIGSAVSGFFRCLSRLGRSLKIGRV